MESMRRYPEVAAAVAGFPYSQADLVARSVTIQQIPAPTGCEAARARWVEAEMRRIGLERVARDEVDNVYGFLPGHSAGPALLVSAHTDTVFAAATDLTVRAEPVQGRLYGPGIGDNSAGVAALLVLAETLGRLPPPPAPIWFVANSGEEGLGDLRGMRRAVDRLESELGACIVIEGMGLGRIVHRGLGSRRYRIHVEAPGGHSWSDFGSASALHVLVQMAAELSLMVVPQVPRTTFNIGRLEGGTSVNTIAQQAWLELDLRSEDPGALNGLVVQALEIVEKYKSLRWTRHGVRVTATTIGDRPAGDLPTAHPLVRAAQAALMTIGYRDRADLRISSTDANIPLSRGIPAVCVGVTDGGNAHRLQEWILTDPLVPGMAHLLELTWWASAWLAGELGEPV
jgi:tripeptide aminopeptidase